jgi:hypothetical protein
MLKPNHIFPMLVASMLSGLLPTLAAPGEVDISFTPPPISGMVDSLLVQSDGKVVIKLQDFGEVGGSVEGRRNARLQADGSLETNFDLDTVTHRNLDAIAQQPDGKLVVSGGWEFIGGRLSRGIARLHQDGTIDGRFPARRFVKAIRRTMARRISGEAQRGWQDAALLHADRRKPG